MRQNVHILLEKNHISQIAACILAQGKSLNFWSIIMKYPVLIDYLACCKLTPIYNCFRHLLGILTVFSMGLFSPYPLDSSSANDRPFKKNKFNSLNVLRFNFEKCLILRQLCIPHSKSDFIVKKRSSWYKKFIKSYKPSS